jgi:Family of unknown function (DUF6882)
MRWIGRRLRGGATAPQQDPDPAFLGFLSEGGLAAYDRQLVFAEIVGDRDWLLDQDNRVLQLGEDLWLPASVLGTASDGDGTWLWAWANPSIEAEMRADAERARALGASRDLDLLTEPEIDLDRIIDGHLLALAVSGALDTDAYYRCPYDGGAAYATVKLSRVRVAHPSPGRRVGEVIRRALVDLPQLVSRPSIEAYVAAMDAAALVEDHRIVVAQGPTLAFDDLGRLVELTETLEPS